MEAPEGSQMDRPKNPLKRRISYDTTEDEVTSKRQRLAEMVDKGKKDT